MNKSNFARQLEYIGPKIIHQMTPIEAFLCFRYCGHSEVNWWTSEKEDERADIIIAADLLDGEDLNETHSVFRDLVTPAIKKHNFKTLLKVK